MVMASTGIVRAPPTVGGGIEAYVTDLTRILVAKGVDVTLVSPIRSPAAFPGAEIVDVPTSFDSFPLKPVSSALAHILGGVSTARAVRSCVSNGAAKPRAVLHVNEEISASVLLRALPKVPTVFTLHNPPRLNGSSATGPADSILRTFGGEWTRRFVVSRADRVVVLTHYLKQYLADEWQVPPEKIAVLPLPLDTDLYVPRREPHDGVRVLFVGRFDLRKNVMVLLHAARHLGPEVRLTLVGDGPLRESIDAFLEAHDLQDRVTLLSRVSPDELIRIYQESDLFVLPSFLESYGRVVIEAAACGLPAILPDAPYFSDFRDHGFARFLTEFTAEALAAAIDDLARDPSLRERMAQAARRFAVETNGYAGFGPRLKALYADVLG